MDKPDVSLKNILDITQDEIDDQIKIREFMKGDMVGTLYPSILNSEIAKLNIMKMHPVQTKIENGFLYFKTRDKWEMAGREDHPLTPKFLKQAINKFYSELTRTTFFT